MSDSSKHLISSQVLNAESHRVKKISDDLGGLTSSELLFSVVKTCGNHVGVNVLSPTCANNLINTIFNDKELTSVEDHAYVRVREVVFLIAAASPWNLGQFARLHVTEEKRVAGRGNKVAVLVDINLGDLMALG